MPKYFPAKAALICQILRRLIAQYCTMNILIKNGGDGGRAVHAAGFLIRTVYLVSTKNKIKTVVRLLLLAGDGICRKAARPVEVNRWWWGALLGWKAWRIYFLIPCYLPGCHRSSLRFPQARKNKGWWWWRTGELGWVNSEGSWDRALWQYYYIITKVITRNNHQQINKQIKINDVPLNTTNTLNYQFCN